MISESSDPHATPTFWIRPKGMPVPLGAQFFNTGLLLLLLLKLGKQPLVDGLKKRKADIMGGMEDAAKMKSEAEAQLEKYEAKLAHVDDEIERVRKEMKEAAESERVRIVKDAEARRERLENDAKLVIQQELKAAREQVLANTSKAALAAAEQLLTKQLSEADHQRLVDDYLAGLGSSVNAKGGRA